MDDQPQEQNNLYSFAVDLFLNIKLISKTNLYAKSDATWR